MHSLAHSISKTACACEMKPKLFHVLLKAPRAPAPVGSLTWSSTPPLEPSPTLCNFHHVPCNCTHSYRFLAGRAPSRLPGKSLLTMKTLCSRYFVHEVLLAPLPPKPRLCSLLSPMSHWCTHRHFAFWCITQHNFICLQIYPSLQTVSVKAESVSFVAQC